MARVLVVDDHAYWRELLSDILGQLGHEVVTAENRRSAIESIQASLADGNPFQLVTLDHNLADSGSDNIGTVESQAVLETLTTYPTPLAVVVISGRADRMDVRDYFRNYGTNDRSATNGILDLDFIDKNDFKVQQFKKTLDSMLQSVKKPKSAEPSKPVPVAENITAEPVKLLRSKVFISYSHKDKNWLEELQITLKPMVKMGALDVWDDQKIRPGQKWKDEIGKALSSAKVAVLLVSRNFLASDFVVDNELPPLLKAAEEEGVSIIWVAVSASSVHQTPISAYQAAHDPIRPLDSLTPAELSGVLVKICEIIQKAVTS